MLGRAKQAVGRVKNSADAKLAMVAALVAMVAKRHDMDWDAQSGRLQAAQVATVLTIVTLGLVIIIGILVYSEVEGSLPTPGNNDLSDASSNATSDFSNAMELAPVIMIILVASVVIGIVSRFQG